MKFIESNKLQLLATLETGRKLGQVSFREDFFDCWKGQEKIGQELTGAVTIPETIAGRITTPGPSCSKAD